MARVLFGIHDHKAEGRVSKRLIDLRPREMIEHVPGLLQFGEALAERRFFRLQ